MKDFYCNGCFTTQEPRFFAKRKNSRNYCAVCAASLEKNIAERTGVDISNKANTEKNSKTKLHMLKIKRDIDLVADKKEQQRIDNYFSLNYEL